MTMGNIPTTVPKTASGRSRWSQLACTRFVHPRHVVQLTCRSHRNAGVPMVCTTI